MHFTVARDFVRNPRQFRLRIFAAQQVVNVPQMPAELLLLFHQVCVVSLLGKRQGRGHARDSASDHQSRFLDLQMVALQRLEQP